MGWCDRSRTRCAELENLERFDGVLPPIKQPWETPWWEIVGGSGMVLTMLYAPPWWIAGILYTVFSAILLPPVREELYCRYLQAKEAREFDREFDEDPENKGN